MQKVRYCHVSKSKTGHGANQSPPGNRESSAPLRLLVVQGWAHPNEWRTVGSDVILVGPELSTFRGDPFELLLSRGIGVSDVHEQALFTNTNSVELADDFIANISVLETRRMISCFFRTFHGPTM